MGEDWLHVTQLVSFKQAGKHPCKQGITGEVLV
jgi:hypothetical protein